MRENGLYELHQELTDCPRDKRDNTYKIGRNQINAIFRMKKVNRAAIGSKLVDFNEIIITNHRGFLIDIDFKAYFKLQASQYDKSESRKLNPTNRLHRKQFKEILDEYISQMKLLGKTLTICNKHETQHKMNVLDELIIYVLTAA